MTEYEEFQESESKAEEEDSETRALKDKLESGTQNVKEKLRQGFDQTRERGKKAIETVGQQTKEKPLMSLLLAFIVGLLLGSSGRLLDWKK